MPRLTRRAVVTLLAALSACSAPAASPSPSSPPSAALPPAPAAHADHGALEAQEHEIALEMAENASRPTRSDHRHHRFEHADEWVAKFDDPTRDAWQKPEAVLAALALQPDSTVADLGAGTGYFTVRLARAAARGRVYAVDLEPDMVRYLGERASREGLTNVTAIVASADDPHLPADVDAAIVVDTYHHIADTTRYFGKLRDRMRPGASLTIVDFKKDAPDDAPGPPPAMRIADDVVVTHLVKLGFSHTRTDRDTLPYQYIVTLTRP